MTTKAPTKRVLKIPALEQANRRVWGEVTSLKRDSSGKLSERPASIGTNRSRNSAATANKK
jgi:hypothetical protein